MTRALLVVLALSASASASPRLLALDDVYDCAFAHDGTLVAATAGGLRLGARVVTSLEGLPETRVDRLELDGDRVRVITRAGSAHVSLGGLVTDVDHTFAPPRPPSTFERFGEGLVRARATAGAKSCIATSDGLYVAEGAKKPLRVKVEALPSGDVAAMAAGAHGVFLGTFDRGLYRFDGTRLVAVIDSALSPQINALAYDAAHKVLWVATARGLARCEDGSALHCRRIGDRLAKHALLVTSDVVIAGGDESLAFFDLDGNLTGESTRKHGARFRSVWSLARSADGTIFAGTTSGIFYGDAHTFVAASDQLHRASMVRGLIADDWVTALALDGNALMIGTYNAGVALLRFSSGELVPERSDPTLGYVNPGGITALGEGRWAIATMTGLQVGAFDGFTLVPTLGRDVTAVVVADGARWVATRRGVTTF